MKRRDEEQEASTHPGSFHSRDEELRTIGVRSSVRHGEEAWLVVLMDEVLVYRRQDA